jgi:hypothetical protein
MSRCIEGTMTRPSDERPDEKTVERRMPDEAAPRRAEGSRQEDDAPLVQLGEDPGTLAPDAE